MTTTMDRSTRRINPHPSAFSPTSTSTSTTVTKPSLRFPVFPLQPTPLSLRLLPPHWLTQSPNTTYSTSSSDSSLPVTPPTPSTPATFYTASSSLRPSQDMVYPYTHSRSPSPPLPPLPHPPQASLGTSTDLVDCLEHFISRSGITTEDACACLEEFAWTSLLAGVRVREYCTQVTQAIRKAPLKGVLGLALIIPAIRLLLPFTTLPVNSYLSLPDPVLAPPLVPSATLPNLRRQLLIDTLAKLSRDSRQLDTEGRSRSIDELVLELCLEYVGRRWRSGAKTSTAAGDDLIEEINRKLTEVEFELQLQGDPATVRSVILPLLHKFRFQLGFVSSSQLVTKLNNIDATSSHRHNHFDPAQLLSSWSLRRLNIGLEPQSLALELCSIRDRLHLDPHKTAATAVLGTFGLLRVTSQSHEGVSEFGVTQPPPDSPHRQAPSPSGFSKRLGTFSRLSSRHTLRKAPPSGPKWFTHRHTNSSTSKLPLPQHNQDRRPSLPVLSHSTVALPATATSLTTSQSGRLNESTTSFGSHTVSDRSNPRESTSTPHLGTSGLAALLSSVMTFSDPEQARLIILDHLLEIRYRFSLDVGKGWLLGSGRLRAVEVLDELEDKIVGRKDVMGLKSVLDCLRAAFHLNATHSDSIAWTRRRPSTRRTQPTSLSFRERDASFDLEQYLDDIGHGGLGADHPQEELSPLAEESSTHRKSSTGASILSFSTAAGSRQSDTFRPSSFLSSFTIREATRTLPMAYDKPREYMFPEPRRGPYEHERMAKSTNDLGYGPDRNGEGEEERYTRLPATLRRTRQRINSLATSLSAHDLGLAHRISTTPTKPSRVPPIQLAGIAPPSSPRSTAAVDYTFPPIARPLTPPTHETPTVLDGPPPSPTPTPPFRLVGLVRTTYETPRRDAISPQRPSISFNPEWSAYETPPRKSSPPLLPVDSPYTSASSTPGGGSESQKSRRNMFRHYAIIGAERSPLTPTARSEPVSPRTVPVSTLPSRNPTALAVVLALFTQEGEKLVPRREVGTVEVDRALSAIVYAERRRVEEAGESWNAEAKRRVAWLIEQLGQEFERPELVQSVERVLRRLSDRPHRPPPLPLHLHRDSLDLSNPPSSIPSTPPLVIRKLAPSRSVASLPRLEPQSYTSLSRLFTQSSPSLTPTAGKMYLHAEAESTPPSPHTFGKNSQPPSVEANFVLLPPPTNHS